MWIYLYIIMFNSCYGYGKEEKLFRNLAFWLWITFEGIIRQCYACCCTGSLYRQFISNHRIDSAGKTDLGLPQGSRFSPTISQKKQDSPTNCAILGQPNAWMPKYTQNARQHLDGLHTTVMNYSQRLIQLKPHTSEGLAQKKHNRIT